MFTRLFMAVTFTLTGLLSNAFAFEPSYFTDFCSVVNPNRWQLDYTPPLSGFMPQVVGSKDNRLDGEWEVRNGLKLATKSEFPAGARIELLTTYEDTSGGDPRYVNQTVITVRATGGVAKQRPWGVSGGGVQLRVEHGHGQVTLEYLDPKTGKATGLAVVFVRANNPEEGLKIVEKPSEYTVPQVASGHNGANWFDVELVDDPKNGFKAFMTWHRRVGEGTEKNRIELLSVTNCEARAKGCDIAALPGKKIVLSTREQIGDLRKPMKSFIRRISIQPVK